MSRENVDAFLDGADAIRRGDVAAVLDGMTDDVVWIAARSAAADCARNRRYARSPGAVAEWLRSGLQSRVHRFDSGRRLDARTPLDRGYTQPFLRL